jgi:hypothetical protein
LVAITAVESWAIHSLLTGRTAGANDFYSRWAGARAFFREGRDPYGLDVTEEIQRAKGIDPELTGKGSFAFPFHVVFSFWPLAFVPYAWAQAIWMVMLQWIVLAVVLLLLRLEDWHPSVFGLLGLVLATLFLYPVARSIFLGQFTLHVLLFLVLGLLALRAGNYGWAGVCLAATSIKPQMVLLIGPWLVLWAVSQRRWRFIGGLLAGGLAMLLASMALLPRWPLSFVEDVFRYSQVAGGRNPLVVLQDLVWPGGPDAVRYVATALLLFAMLLAWRRSWGKSGMPFVRSVHWTLVVSLLATFQTGTTNQVLLLVPLFAWLSAAMRRGWRWPLTAAVVGLEVALWFLFLGTIHGDWEDPIMFLPLPLLSLGVLVAVELVCWWRGRSARVASQAGPA